MHARTLLLAMPLLASCATVEPTKPFAGVEQLTKDRGVHELRWNTGSEEDAEVDRRVAALFQQGLTGERAVQIALLNNRGLQATYESLGVAQADLVEAGLLRNPSLSASLRFPIVGALADLEVAVAQDFLDLFTRPLRKRFAARALEQAQLRVANEVLSLTTQVQATFYELLAAQQMTELRRTLLDAELAATELSERQRAAGNITELELQNQRALSVQLRLDLGRSEYEVLAIRERLNRLLGAWGGQTGWKTAEELPALPYRDDLDPHLEALAVKRRLDLEAARREVEGAEAAVSLARNTRFFGRLDVGASAGRDPEGNVVVGPTLDLELPVFHQGQPAIARAEARLRQARAQLAALAVDVRSEVRAARNRLEGARAVAEQYRDSLLPLRERVVELSQLQYNAMQIGTFQLIQAKQAEITAYREYLDAVREYWVARTDLARAAGGTLVAPAKEGGAS